MSKRKRTRATAPRRRRLAANDGPPQERFNQDALVIEGTGVPHYRVTTQTTLDRYKARQELDPTDRKNNDRLWLAGDYLRADLFLSQIAPKVVSQLRPRIISGGGGDDTAVRSEAARHRVKAARDAVGPIMWPVVLHVCGDYGPARDFAKGLRGVSGAMMALQLGLESVARYYRVGNRDRKPRNNGAKSPRKSN